LLYIDCAAVMFGPLAQNIQSRLPQQAEAAPPDRVFAVDYKHLFGVTPVNLDL
jgi:hypothetical protein